ncbi:MAG: Esterase, partial [Actinomycetia bacterium]|nr:Esterase [Actinomycetes bacterium]
MKRGVFAGVVVCLLLCAASLPVAAQSTAREPFTSRHELVSRALETVARNLSRGADYSAATSTQLTANDPTGDIGEPRADITHIAASYGPRRLTLSVNMAHAVDPRHDPLWRGDTGFLLLEWAIDVNGDGVPDYIAEYGMVGAAIFADVITLPPLGAPLPERFQTCGAVGSYGASAYTIVVPTDCILNAPHLHVAAGTALLANINAPTPNFDSDLAPNKGFIGIDGPPGGYVLAAADGGAFAYGTVRFAGSLGNLVLASPITAVAATGDGRGYALLGADGGIFTFGTVRFHGAPAAVAHGTDRFVSVALTPTGNGYWVLGASGGVYSFGDARFFGARATGAPAVALASTHTGHGYWVAAADGSVYAYGDARFFGAASGVALHAPLVSIMPTVTGRGYWLVGGDGGVFSYGDARFFGSTGALALRAPVVAAVPTPAGQGYTMVASDGGVFVFGDARFFGSAAALQLRRPVVA